MIRQAQSYLAGAASSAALISAAVAAFVLLASLAAFHEWPAPNLGASAENVPVVNAGSPAEAAAGALTPAGNFVAARAPNGAVLPGGGVFGVPATNSVPAGSQGPAGGTFDPSDPNSVAPPGQTTPTQGVPTSSPETSPSSTSLSQNLSSSVNNTTNSVDNTLGGALSATGVNQTVQSVSQNTVGPGTAGGNVVDGVGGTLAGLTGN